MRQSFRFLAPAAAAAIVVAGLAMPRVWAQEGQPAGGGQPDRPRQPGQQPGGPGNRGGQNQTVEGSMRMMNRGVNQLKATIGDPAKKDESLQAVWQIQRGCLGAKANKPEHLEGDTDKMLDAFRRGQIKLMGILLELETAILDGKTDEAKALFAKAAEHRDASHKLLGVKMDEAGGEGGAGGGGGGGGGGGVR